MTDQNEFGNLDGFSGQPADDQPASPPPNDEQNTGYPQVASESNPGTDFPPGPAENDPYPPPPYYGQPDTYRQPQADDPNFAQAPYPYPPNYGAQPQAPYYPPAPNGYPPQAPQGYSPAAYPPPPPAYNYPDAQYGRPAAYAPPKPQDSALTKKPYSSPVILKILAFFCLAIVPVFLFEDLYYFLRDISNLADIIRDKWYLMEIVWIFADLINFSAVLLITIGLFRKPRLFGTGCFLLSIPYFIYVFTSTSVPNKIWDFFAFSILIVCGLHYMLKGKGINNVVKLVLGILFGVVDIALTFYYYLVETDIFRWLIHSLRFSINDFYSFFDLIKFVLPIICYLLFAILIALIIALYNPYKKRR